MFSGYSTSSLDIAFTLREGKLYLGDSAFTDAILYTFSEGQIFIGDSTFPMDVAYTLRGRTARFGALETPRFGASTKKTAARGATAWRCLKARWMPGLRFALLSATGWLWFLFVADRQCVVT